MSRCRFLLDECLPSSLWRGLQRHHSEVIAFQVGRDSAPSKGILDPALLEYCERERLLLVTADRTTLPDHIRGHHANGDHTWGVLVVGPDASLARTIEDLAIIYEATEADEWFDVLFYLPISAR
jgi:hypothetical protein